MVGGSALGFVPIPVVFHPSKSLPVFGWCSGDGALELLAFKALWCPSRGLALPFCGGITQHRVNASGSPIQYSSSAVCRGARGGAAQFSNSLFGRRAVRRVPSWKRSGHLEVLAGGASAPRESLAWVDCLALALACGCCLEAFLAGKGLGWKSGTQPLSGMGSAPFGSSSTLETSVVFG